MYSRNDELHSLVNGCNDKNKDVATAQEEITEEVIVDYGSMMRPSYPDTTECIEKWLK